ncbi:hypothetical protein [Maribacter sp.]
MKLSRIVLSFFAFVLMVNCAKDEEPTPNPETEEKPISEVEEPQEQETEVYFEVTIGDNLSTEIADNWLIIHDMDGKLIDYKSFEKNDILRFEKPTDSVPNIFTVTELYVGTLTGRAPFTFRSYTEIPRGSNWTIGILNYSPSPYYEPEVTGNFDIIVSGRLLAPSMQVISNKEGIGTGTGAYRITTNTNNGDWVYEKPVELFEHNDYYLTLMNGFGETRYHYLSDVQNGDFYNLTFNEFSRFDSHINLSLPLTSQIFFSLRSYPETPISRTSPGYDFYFIPGLITGQGVASSFELGYLGNTFESHSFYLTAILDDYSYNYDYFGSELPNDLIVPERPVLNIANSDIYNFMFSTDIEYKRTINSWTTAVDLENPDKRKTDWSVFAPSNSSSIIGILPDEIIGMYPEMNVSSLSYKASTLFVGPQTYEEYLDLKFSGKDYINSLRTNEYFTFNNQP